MNIKRFFCIVRVLLMMPTFFVANQSDAVSIDQLSIPAGGITICLMPDGSWVPWSPQVNEKEKQKANVKNDDKTKTIVAIGFVACVMALVLSSYMMIRSENIKLKHASQKQVEWDMYLKRKLVNGPRNFRLMLNANGGSIDYYDHKKGLPLERIPGMVNGFKVGWI